MPRMRTSRRPKKNPKPVAKRNIDPVTLYYGLSSAQVAHQMGLDKKLGLTGGGGKPKRWKNPEDIDILNEVAPIASRGHIEFTQDGIERFYRDGYVYIAFTNTPVYSDGYRMGTPEESAQDFAYRNPAKFERCVKDVQESSRRSGRPANAYAVCTAAGLRNPRRNPEEQADAVYEEFHGAPPQETLEIQETEHVHGHLGGLGDLVSIEVRLTAGRKAGSMVTLTAPDPDRAAPEDIVHVASNEARNQMYLVGGDQRVDLQALGFRKSFDVVHDGEHFDATDIKDLMVLGEITKLTYRTQKEFDQFELVDYFHKIGEDTKVRPSLLYDTLNDRMKIAGGEYTIHAKGIVN